MRRTAQKAGISQGLFKKGKHTIISIEKI